MQQAGLKMQVMAATSPSGLRAANDLAHQSLGDVVCLAQHFPAITSAICTARRFEF